MAQNQAVDSLGDLLDHEYDGIREYDNPCPGWWVWLFFATVVFAPFYFFYFHVGKAGITIEKAHENAVSENLRLRFADIGELAHDEPTLLEYMQQPKWLQVGQSVYKQKCKACHAEEGRGNVGPNMTDDYYKNVEQLGDILHVVTVGAASGSMPASGRLNLHHNDILLVSAYVASLRGKNLPGPRGQEGKEIPPWPAFVGPDDAEPKTNTEADADAEAAAAVTAPVPPASP